MEILKIVGIVCGSFILAMSVLVGIGCCRISSSCSRKEEEDEIKELFEEK